MFCVLTGMMVYLITEESAFDSVHDASVKQKFYAGGNHLTTFQVRVMRSVGVEIEITALRAVHSVSF